MKRILPVLIVAGYLAAGAVAARAQDEVSYYDRAKKSEAKVRGVIQQESPSEIVVKVGARTEKIPALDVSDVAYQLPLGVNRLDYRRPSNKEDDARKAAGAGNDARRKEAVQEAVAGYKELLPKFKERPLIQRHVAYRLTQLLAWEAEQDPAQLDAAVAALTEFQQTYPDGWQIVASTKTLGRLLEKKGDLAAVRKLYEELAARKDIPRETRQECELLVVRALLENSKHEDAEKKLQGMAQGLGSDDPQAQRVQVFLAACQVARGNLPAAEKQLGDVIGKSADADVKALAHNALGDCYLKKGQPQEAFWHYLWVDTMYNQDKAEHAKALYHLSRLFEEVRKDVARGMQCRERLVKDKQFAGLEYQKRALREDKQKDSSDQ